MFIYFERGKRERERDEFSSWHGAEKPMRKKKEFGKANGVLKLVFQYFTL